MSPKPDLSPPTPEVPAWKKNKYGLSLLHKHSSKQKITDLVFKNHHIFSNCLGCICLRKEHQWVITPVGGSEPQDCCSWLHSDCSSSRTQCQCVILSSRGWVLPYSYFCFLGVNLVGECSVGKNPILRSTEASQYMWLNVCNSGSLCPTGSGISVPVTKNLHEGNTNMEQAATSGSEKRSNVEVP